MKKKVIVSLCIVLAVILLFPVRLLYKDGGTVEYKAVLYSVKDVHCLNFGGDAEEPYLDGWVIEILGFTVYDSVPWNN